MLEKLFSYRNIVMIVLIVINITITATQSEFDEYGSDSGSFEDFIFTDGNSRETKESHAATVNFLHHSKPGESPTLTMPNSEVLLHFFGFSTTRVNKFN